MLKIFISLLFVMFIIPVTLYGQDVMGNMETLKQPKLQLNVKILNQRYCSKEDLVLDLQLTFTNIGKKSIILDKNSDLVYSYQEEPVDKYAKKHLPQNCFS